MVFSVHRIIFYEQKIPLYYIIMVQLTVLGTYVHLVPASHKNSDANSSSE